MSYTEITFQKDNKQYKLHIVQMAYPTSTIGDLYIEGKHTRAFLWRDGRQYRQLVTEAAKRATEIGIDMKKNEFSGLPKEMS